MNIKFVEHIKREADSEPPLPDVAIVNWLSNRNFVEATDSGLEDPHRFTTDYMMHKGSFRQQISEHIRRVTK